MGKGRLEAFTDGVIAIVITIMVLELKVPHGADLAALQSSMPVFLAYVLSYANVGIFWNNHHHMLHATERVNGTVLWANLFFLFWISLVPFAIRWIDETGFTALPTAAYGVVLAMAAFGYMLLERAIIADFGLVRAWRGDRHGNLVYRASARNFNPLAAMCGRVTVAEVEELVEPGELDPNQVHTPGVFVHRVVALTPEQAADKRIERRTVRPRPESRTVRPRSESAGSEGER